MTRIYRTIRLFLLWVFPSAMLVRDAHEILEVVDKSVNAMSEELLEYVRNDPNMKDVDIETRLMFVCRLKQAIRKLLEII